MSAARSIRPIDIGQIEGGFVQGMGWLTTEELVFDERGPAPHPCAVDLQDSLRLRCAGRFPRRAVRVGRQPRGHDLPLQGGRRAAADAGDLGVLGHHRCASPRLKPGGVPPLDAPATPEAIMRAVKRACGHEGHARLAHLAEALEAHGRCAMVSVAATSKARRRARRARG